MSVVEASRWWNSTWVEWMVADLRSAKLRVT
jgi:hypothetical protein